jgi:hypothetical protein
MVLNEKEQELEVMVQEIHTSTWLSQNHHLQILLVYQITQDDYVRTYSHKHPE